MNVPDEERRLGEKGQVQDLTVTGCICEAGAAELRVQDRGLPGVPRTPGEGAEQTGPRRDPEPQVRRGGEATIETWVFSPGPSQREQLCKLGVGCTGARGSGRCCELGVWVSSLLLPAMRAGDRPARWKILGVRGTQEIGRAHV